MWLSVTPSTYGPSSRIHYNKAIGFKVHLLISSSPSVAFWSVCIYISICECMYSVIYLYSFIKICYVSHLGLKLYSRKFLYDRYLHLAEALSLELECYPQQVAPKKCLVVNTGIVTCGGCGHPSSNFEIISGKSKLFRDKWAKTDFRDPSGTQVRNPGLSRRFRDSRQLRSLELHQQLRQLLRQTMLVYGKYKKKTYAKMRGG